MCLGVGLFASILFGGLYASWTCVSTSFTKLGKFSFIIFSNRFPISCSFSSPSSTPMRRMLESLKLSQKLLILSSFFGFFFLPVVLCGFLLPYVPNHWFDSQLHLLYCCFPVNCSLFQLMYPLFWLGLFCASEVLVKGIIYCTVLYLKTQGMSGELKVIQPERLIILTQISRD